MKMIFTILKKLSHRLFLYFTIPLSLSLLLAHVNCSKEGNNAPDITISIEFSRIDSGGGLDPFKAIVNLTENGSPVSGASPEIYVAKPSENSNPFVSAVTDNGDGFYEFTVTPDQTGEHPVSVSYKGTSITQTPLVLSDVHADLGQPLAVSGDVNTAGYEDDINVTPDGKHLFVLTGPIRWSGFWVYAFVNREDGGCECDRLNPNRCNHPWIDQTISDSDLAVFYSKRPGFYTSRFDGITQLHNAASWGFGTEEFPFYTLTSLIYGFEKQSDGSFKKPFLLDFEDSNTGIVDNMGYTFMDNGDGTYTTVFSLKDTGTTDFGWDVYTFGNVIPGEKNNLGEYIAGTSSPPARGINFPSEPVDLGDNSGTQGNPFIYYNGTEVKSIWTDDEYDGDADTNKISVYVLNSGTFPSSNDWTKVVLPSNVNQAGKKAITPTFIDSDPFPLLIFDQDNNIVFSAYTGDHDAIGFNNNANWTEPVMLLEKDDSCTLINPDSTHMGKIITAGQPSVAMVEGKMILYFLYAYIRGIDPITGIADLDFQAGFVPKN